MTILENRNLVYAAAALAVLAALVLSGIPAVQAASGTSATFIEGQMPTGVQPMYLNWYCVHSGGAITGSCRSDRSSECQEQCRSVCGPLAANGGSRCVYGGVYC